VESPYNGIQPFIALPRGEFVILEHDETDISKSKATNSLRCIDERVHSDRSITFEKSKSIEVAPEWLAITIKDAEHISGQDLHKTSKIFGGKLAHASIDDNCPDTAEKLIDFMKRETFGRPMHEFTAYEIGDCRIHQKI
jgi:hypothetical protein